MPLYIWLALEKADLGSAQYLLAQVRLQPVPLLLLWVALMGKFAHAFCQPHAFRLHVAVQSAGAGSSRGADAEGAISVGQPQSWHCTGGLMLGELLNNSRASSCFQALMHAYCIWHLAEMLWQPAHPAILLHCSTSMLQSGQPAALRIAEIRCSRFLYSPRRQNFVAVPALPPDFDRRLQACCAALQGTSRGRLIAAHASAGSRSSVPAELDHQDRGQALAVFGHNEMVLPVASFLQLLVDEM